MMSSKSKSNPVKLGRGSSANQPAANIIHATRETHSGPIPDPLTLEKYEKVHPGLADRIMKMAENESAHRHSIEKTEQERFYNLAEKEQSNSSSSNSRAQWLSFLLIFIALAGGITLLMFDKQIAGGLLSGAGLVPAVKVLFTTGRGEKTFSPKVKKNTPAKQKNNHSSTEKTQ